MEEDYVQITKLEVIFIVGIVGCMLFATWELGHLMADEWFYDWVSKDSFTNERIIRYGIAALMSITSLVVTTKFVTRFGRFGSTVNRAFLWYGTLLLISTISIFVFDCLPEVFAGFIGAILFIIAIYFLQKKYYSKERVIKSRLEKGNCFHCGSKLLAEALCCSDCGEQVGMRCPDCKGYVRVKDKFCSNCKREMS